MQHVFRNPLLPFISIGFVMGSSVVGAENLCKQLPQESCVAQPACTWVSSYVRSDGREVSAYCRNAPIRKEKQQSMKSSQEIEKAVKG